MKTAWKITIALLAIPLVFVVYALFNTFTGKAVDAGLYDDFAQCLTEKGAIFWGSFECPHCGEQKDLFGDSMKYVNYIECGPLRGPIKEVCKEAGIRAYPTWDINGNRYTGVQSLEKLSQLTNCPI